MTTRIVTDANGRKHITNEPLLHPPQRTWVGLTDKEILANDVLRYHFGLNGGAGPVSKSGRKIVDALEAALKKKTITPCGHEETIVKGSLVHCKKCDRCFGVD